MDLVLKSKIEVPAFHLFITKEQDKRDENNKLSVFRLLALYKIQQGRVVNIDAVVLNDLLEGGLVVQDGERLKLCASYYDLEKYAR